MKRLRVFHPENGTVGTLTVDNSIPASENNALIKGISAMLAATSGRDSLRAVEIGVLREHLRRNDVTAEELVEAFWEADMDAYVSVQTGIQFRHLWKSIQKRRKVDRPLMTYEEMLYEMDKKSLPQSAYELVPTEKDAKGRGKWRRTEL